MNPPPPRPGVSPPEKVAALRRASLRDLPGLLGIERASYRHPWSAAEMEREIAKPGFWVADEGAFPAGFGVYWSVAGEAQLANLAVHPERRGGGLARRLLAHLMERAGAEGLFKMTLEVGERNVPARALYRDHGFRETGRRPGYYWDGQAAVLMERRLDP